MNADAKEKVCQMPSALFHQIHEFIPVSKIRMEEQGLTFLGKLFLKRTNRALMKDKSSQTHQAIGVNPL